MKKRSDIDRRGSDFFIPRQYNRRERVFLFNRRIYLTDTNSFQNVYFARFFDFMGEAREDLLRYLLGEQIEEVLSSGIVLLTRDCYFKYQNSLFLYDDITVEVSLNKLTKMRIVLGFKISNNTRKEVTGQGVMTIACTDSQKLCKIPDLLHDALYDLFVEGCLPNHIKIHKTAS